MKAKNVFFILLAFLISLSIMIYFGKDFYQKAPPIPRAVATHHELLFTHEDIKEGQKLWHSQGIVQGSSKDWVKDWHAREAQTLVNIWSQKETGKDFEQLEDSQKNFFLNRLSAEYMKSGIDADGRLTLSKERAQAIKSVSEYYLSLFEKDKKFSDLDTSEKKNQVLAYFFWRSWITTTKREMSDELKTLRFPFK